MSTAQVTNISIENVTDPLKPYVYKYHIMVPGYAQRTGKRLFLQPAFFQFGVSPLFTTSSRQHSIYFNYPWSENDEVTFELPAGFTLDSAESPAPFSSPPISEYKPTAGITPDGKTLVYKRSFYFGGDGTILFPVSGYPQLKNYFDELHKQDGHIITLKQTAALSAK